MPAVKIGRDADLAFAVVVLASLLAAFSSSPNPDLVEILLIVLLSTAYILMGIYGYAYAAQSSELTIKLIYFTVQVLLGGLILVFEQTLGFNTLLLLPLSGHSVFLLPLPWMLAVNGLIALAYVLTALFLSSGSIWSDPSAGLQIFLAGQVLIILFTQMAVNEQLSRLEVERLLSDLAAANQRLRDYARQVEDLAVTQERNRLAREIHDGLGHYLTTIHIQIQAARAVLQHDPVKAGRLLETSQNLTHQALAEVRTSVAALRTSTVDTRSLPERITQLAENIQQADLDAHVKILGKPRTLTGAAQLTLLRAVQEGLNNVQKHAHAATIWISLDYTHLDEVCLSVRDDGVGSVEPVGGFGLLSLEERANLLDGEFHVTTTPEQGFAFELRIPG
jgi:signal transduction histidine kinase